MLRFTLLLIVAVDCLVSRQCWPMCHGPNDISVSCLGSQSNSAHISVKVCHCNNKLMTFRHFSNKYFAVLCIVLCCVNRALKLDGRVFAGIS